MSITVEKTTAAESETWDDHVERSPHGTIFHQFEALLIQAEHVGATLHPLVGYKGEEPIGILPLFEIEKGPLSFGFSPPPGLRIYYLGPALLNFENLKQRKREQRHRRFIDACIEWTDAEIGPRYLSLRTDWCYDDVRPFMWNGFDVQPTYTYIVDLDADEETVIKRFSRTTRREIRNHLDGDYVVEDRGTEAIDWIIGRVNDRFAEQGESTPITSEFVVDLYERLPDGQVRPYVLSVDGTLRTGTILLEYGDTAHRWQGGVRPDIDLPANELLEWHMMREARERGVTDYDIVDANFPRLNEWKAKFGPEVRSYHAMKRGSTGVDAALRLYERVRDWRTG